MPFLPPRRASATGPWFGRMAWILALWLAGGSCALAENEGQAASLKKLSIEELMNIEVTSVSRRPEKLLETASAIQVITNEDIRRSGATSLAEALRLAPNLQVAQINASQWAISSRGFNNALANKLLVLVDGRTVYTPLYAGVFWDAQDTLLADLDQIEVVSGPGGALWGANAVNGVINITTKPAQETQGLYVEGGAGTAPNAFGGIRYGGRLSPNLYYRVYAKAFSRDSTVLLNGADANDDWSMRQGGLRLDWAADDSERVTLQADLYRSKPNPDGGVPVQARGGNVLGRWTRSLSADSDFRLQWYYDKTRRDFGNGFTEDLATYDFDGQHRFQAGPRQEIVWGAGVRLMQHEVTNLPLFAFLPARKTLRLYSAFLQDEIALREDSLRLTLGAKFEHNDYTGFEFQPSVRLAWSPTRQQTFWTAVSQAVRTPARIDRDFTLLLTPAIALIGGGPNFDTEDVVAYELGWHLQPRTDFSLSIAAFYNDYDNLRSAEPGPPPLNVPITFANGVRGRTYGTEWMATYQAAEGWRLRGGYTWMQKRLEVKPGNRDLNQATVESDDPENQFLLQSMLDLPGALELDAVIRAVDSLPKPFVPGYLSLDLRLGWKATENLELEIVGQNLLDARHPEFVPSSPSPREIERAVYGKITWRL